MEKRRRGRKLLIATMGLAAVNYVACGSDSNPAGDGGKDVFDDFPVANIMPPPPDTGITDAKADGDARGPDADADRGDGPDEADVRNDAKD